MTALPWKRVHFTGIGGVGMSGLAHILLDWGVTVSGTDTEDSDFLQGLQARAEAVQAGHDPALVDGADLLVHSSAVASDHPELLRARALGIPVCRRGEFLADIARRYPTIVAVAGSHGKTTTSAMVAHILAAAGCAPGFLVGGRVNGWNRSARAGSGQVFITEVDESDRTQALLRATFAVVLNVDDDHCWSVGGVEALEQCFVEFADSAAHLVTWESATTRRLLAHHRGARFVTPADVPADLCLRVPGAHNRGNAAVAVTVAKVRPWKLPSHVMNLYFSLAVCSRASFNAASFASAPLLQKKHLPPNARSLSILARRPCGSE